MSIEKQWCMFSAGAALVLGLSVSSLGCRADNQTTGTGGNGTGGDGATTIASSSSGSSMGGNGGAGGGSGGAGGQGPTCGGDTVTIEQVTNPKATGAVGKGLPVTVNGAVVMSQKFLVSKSSSGNCLYGVFVSAPGLMETAPYSGVMVVAYGSPATIPQGQTQSYCGKISNRTGTDPLPGDVIPDDIKPGEVVNLSGTADYFLLSACAGEMNGSQVAQRQISFTCAFERTGKTETPPTPHAFTTAEEILQVASPTDTAFHDMWGGVKVRVEGVKPVPQPDPGGGTGMVVVGDFGIITMQDSNLEVGDKLYYRGYDKQTCFKGPAFSDLNITWTAVDGFNYLNYCTWGLQPNNKCVDFNPASEDCSGVVCQ